MGKNGKLSKPLFTQYPRGAALVYLIIAIPLASLISLFLPGTFSPMVTAAFTFPVFFYFTRRELYRDTFLMIVFGGILQFAIVALLTTFYKDIVTQWTVDFGEIAMFGGIRIEWDNSVLTMVSKAVGLLFTAVMALISGGALILFSGVAVINSVAINMGGLITDGSGWTVAFMSVTPWELSSFIGHGLVSIGVASLFYIKIEKRGNNFNGLVEPLTLGIIFVLLDIYLELEMGEAWRSAQMAALSLR
ncbi:hypothetical protein MNBD_NITROSPINAE02-664 [hydrothermal vent metagenome]|uniref:Uncharacterized protein n=1 Tax=hydrothermal vent metagenome TaxID=652676 RepID=A0A3B1C580_9ZZZZ